MGGPSSKAKYSQLTDSEPVPWGKGEKNPCEGSEIEPETVHVQAVEAPSLSFFSVWHFNIPADKTVEHRVFYAQTAKIKQREFSDGVTAYLLYNGSATYIL